MDVAVEDVGRLMCSGRGGQSKRGLGRIRHREVEFLWLQEVAKAGRDTGGGDVIRQSKGTRFPNAWANLEDYVLR